MNLLFTVCGRAGSKGCKSKNTKDFLGIPLLYYTIAAIELYIEEHNDDIIDICINTDSEKLVKLTQERNQNIVIIPRTPEMAGDTAAKMPVIQACLKHMEELKKLSYDCVIDLDLTSPIRTTSDIYNAIQKRGSLNFDVVFSVTGARRNPYFNMVKQNPDGSCNLVIPTKFTTRQQTPALFDMNASIYAYLPDFLRNNETGRLFDGKCSYIEMPDTGIVDIDSEHDFMLMEIIMKYMVNKDDKLKQIYETAQNNM